MASAPLRHSLTLPAAGSASVATAVPLALFSGSSVKTLLPLLHWSGAAGHRVWQLRQLALHPAPVPPRGSQD